MPAPSTTINDSDTRARPCMRLTPELEHRIKAFLLAQEQAEAMNSSGEGGGRREVQPSGNKQHIQQLCARAQGILGKLAPFGLQILVSGFAYSTGLCIAQIVGTGLRISCVTPVLSSCMGLVGVGASSAFSGHMSRHTKRQMDAGKNPLQALLTPFWHDFNPEEAVLDAVSGAIIFKMSGGAFCRLMPSDLRAPGACGHHSIPLSSAKYATDAEKSHLVSVFNRDGCHHCGSWRGPVIGDHIPPNKMVQDARQAMDASVLVTLKTLLSKAGAKIPEATKQAYYAQCQNCSKRQSALMRHGRRSALVFHRLLIGPGMNPGILVGFRQLCSLPPAGEPPPGAHKNGGGKRGGAKQVERQPGIWSWAVRMEEQAALPLGQDVFRSFEDKGLLEGASTSKVAAAAAH